jgi:UDP-glucose 4-epimerase
MKKKKILLLGGYGFIGDHFFNIYKNKYTIKRLGKFTKKKKISLGNLRKIKTVFDIIIDCSGSSSVTKSILKPDIERNKTFSAINHICKYISRLNVKPIYIFISSAAVYGNSNNNNLKPISNYGKNKLKVEKKLILLSKKQKMRLLIIRFYSIFGNGLKKQLIWDAFNKIKRNNFVFFGTGEEKRSWMHVLDAISFINSTLSLSLVGGKIIDAPSKYTLQNKILLKIIIKTFFQKDITPIFNNIVRKGDPKNLFTKFKLIKGIKWKQKISLKKGIKDYSRWFQKK